MTPIGTRSCTFGDRFAEDDLRRAAASGFDAVELSFNRTPALDWSDDRAAVRLRAAAERLGLMLTAHAPEEPWLSDPDAEGAASAARRMSGMVPGMSRYGVRSVVAHACPYRPAVPGRAAEQAESLCRSLAALAGDAERCEVVFLVETLTLQGGTFSSCLDNILAAVERVGSTWVGVCVDTNHLNTTEPLNAAVARAGRWLGECHCNDNHGVREEHLLPFDGIIDWAGLAAALSAIPFVGPLVLEPSRFDEERFDDVLAAASDAARRLRICLDVAYRNCSR